MTIIKQFLLFLLCFFLVETVQARGHDSAARLRARSTHDDQYNGGHQQQREARVDGVRVLRRQNAQLHIAHGMNTEAALLNPKS